MKRLRRAEPVRTAPDPSWNAAGNRRHTDATAPTARFSNISSCVPEGTYGVPVGLNLLSPKGVFHEKNSVSDSVNRVTSERCLNRVFCRWRSSSPDVFPLEMPAEMTAGSRRN